MQNLFLYLFYRLKAIILPIIPNQYERQSTNGNIYQFARTNDS